LLSFIEFEATAVVTWNFQPLSVPGLLQTEDYARALLGSLRGELSAEQVAALTEARIKRQELLDRDDAPLLYFVVDEAVARRIVGGRDVMRAQLNRMIQLAGRPRITLELVPFHAGAHQGMNGPFVIHEFSDPDASDVLFQERPQGDELRRDDPELIAQYRERFRDLRELSLGPEGSVSFLRELAQDLDLRALAAVDVSTGAAGQRHHPFLLASSSNGGRPVTGPPAVFH
jgi:hypothetical protein